MILEALAVVLDLDQDLPPFDPQRHPHPARPGMLADVGERLLHDADQLQLDLRRQVDLLVGGIVDRDPGVILPLRDVGAQRGG